MNLYLNDQTTKEYWALMERRILLKLVPGGETNPHISLVLTNRLNTTESSVSIIKVSSFLKDPFFPDYYFSDLVAGSYLKSNSL